MVADYKKGITPNPDILCNEKIKFGAFMQWALKEGADIVATGHYAQVGERDGRAVLTRGADAGKDQSYFLYRISSEDLAHVIFPIGGMHKADVRIRARAFGLPISEKPDSQGLCFVGDVSMHDFLCRFISVEAGDVFDTKGILVGRHDGAALYTVGQRHGFTIGYGNQKSEDVPRTSQYITAIDTVRNTLTVSADRNDAARKETYLRDMHWITTAPKFPLRAQVQARYHETPIAAVISQTEKGIVCSFDALHIASPGQSLVIYDGDACLGGGVIDVFSGR